MVSIQVTNFPEWRDKARALLQQGISPQSVSWHTARQPSLFQDSITNVQRNTSPKQKSSVTQPTHVPKQFLLQLENAACYIDAQDPAQKWALFYSLLWQVVKVNRGILNLSSDPEVRTLKMMIKSVNRDRHKMQAFLRFQKAADGDEEFLQSQDYYTAWFEPEHAIVDSIAPFFVKRFTGMSWSILTPHGCAHWNQKNLKLSDGISRPEIADDEYDDFWRTYYCNIFNPARLKESAMRNEMPKKYWRYLPEAQCIKDLSRGAAHQQNRMLENEATDSNRIRDRSATLTEQQNELRSVNRT